MLPSMQQVASGALRALAVRKGGRLSGRGLGRSRRQKWESVLGFGAWYRGNRRRCVQMLFISDFRALSLEAIGPAWFDEATNQTATVSELGALPSVYFVKVGREGTRAECGHKTPTARPVQVNANGRRLVTWTRSKQRACPMGGASRLVSGSTLLRSWETAAATGPDSKPPEAARPPPETRASSRQPNQGFCTLPMMAQSLVRGSERRWIVA